MKNIILLFISGSLFAINIQQFTRSNTLTFEMLDDARMRNSHVYTDSDLTFTLGGSYVDEPLVRKNTANSKQFDVLISNMWTMHFGVSVYLLPELSLGATSFYSWFKDVVGNDSKSGLGDTNLSLTYRLLHQKKSALAIMPFVTIDTSSSSSEMLFQTTSNGIQKMNPLSDESLGLGGMLIYEHLFKYFNIVANVGYKKADGGNFDEIKLRERLMTGIGAYIPISRSVGINAEFMRHWGIPFNSNQNPNEFYVGSSFGLTKGIAGFAGVGLGNLFSSTDGNDYRVSAGIKYSPRIWSKERKAIRLVNKKFKPKKKFKPAPVELQELPEEKTKVVEVVKEVKTPVAPECKKKIRVFGNNNKYVVRFPHDVGVVLNPKQVNYLVSNIVSSSDSLIGIDIIGHTSAVGSADYNQRLSEKRARSIGDMLIKGGAPIHLINPIGMGENELLDRSGSKRAEFLNRRVEIIARLKERREEVCE